MNKEKSFDEGMLDILCCPSCHGDLDYKNKESKLICAKCGKEFVVKDGIPLLLAQCMVVGV